MKKHNIVFKRLKEGDLKQLHEWFQLPSILKWYARDKQYTLEEIQEKHRPRINDRSIPNFIIYDQNKPVGYIQFYCLPDHLPEGMDDNHPLFISFKPNDLVGIDLFIADENYLQIGFVTTALSYLIKTYLKKRFKAILVDPLKENIVAIAFFEKNGFKQVMSRNDNHELMLKDIVQLKNGENNG